MIIRSDRMEQVHSDIRGELFRALEEKLGSDDERERKTAALALQYGLNALDGNLN